MKPAKDKTPAHLRPPTRDWWRTVVSTYSLEEHHVCLLTLACESLDRVEQAREIIAKQGPVVLDRFGSVRRHPAVGIELDNKIAFVRLIRELGLDVAEPGPIGRPPSGGGK